MSKPEMSFLDAHKDADFFREAVNFTAAETSFSPRLIEKDYFNTVLLKYLSGDGILVFKGGTCLAKVHSGFYRMSEDLDFAISMPFNASRAQRSKNVAGFKQHFAALSRQEPYFSIVQSLTGANNSTQYTGVIGYSSLLSRQKETINVDVGLREPVLTPVKSRPARTILIDPVSGKSMVTPIGVRCLSAIESFAEKFRAALCRREAAIRDFYDIDYAIRMKIIHPLDSAFIGMVRRKLAVPDIEPIDVSSNRLLMLRQQLETQLKPVLRDREYAEFDLVRVFETVTEVAAKVA